MPDDSPPTGEKIFPDYASPPPMGIDPMGSGYRAPMPQRVSASAVVSLVCGIVGCLPVLPSMLAIIFGFIGLRKTRDNRLEGRGMAITGLVLGILGFIIWSVIIATAIEAYVVTRPQRVTAEQFMNDVAAGHSTAALARCTSNVPSSRIQRATTDISNWGYLQSVTADGSTVTLRNGIQTQIISGQLDTGGVSHAFKVTFIKQNGVWKIDGFSYK